MKRSSILRALAVVACVALLPLALSACSGKTSGSSSAPPGRGSSACQAWQDALCGFVSKCGSASGNASTCQNQAKGVVCKSDSAASACATQLNAASCAAPPASCDLLDIADPSAAVAPCNAYLGAVCDAAIRCKSESNKPSCLTTEQAQVNCSTIYSVGLGYETCLKDLGTVSCASTDLPTSCTGMLYAGPAPQN